MSLAVPDGMVDRRGWQQRDPQRVSVAVVAGEGVRGLDREVAKGRDVHAPAGGGTRHDRRTARGVDAGPHAGRVPDEESRREQADAPDDRERPEMEDRELVPGGG